MTLLSSDSSQVKPRHACSGVHASSGGGIGQASIARDEAAVGVQKVWVTRLHSALSVIRCTSDLLWSGLDPGIPYNNTQFFLLWFQALYPAGKGSCPWAKVT